MRTCLSLLGPSLDNGFNTKRWERWRPNVALCHHDDLLIDRLVLLYEADFAPLAEVIVGDIAQVSPETKVEQHLVEFADAWDFADVYGQLFDFSQSFAFSDDDEYLVHITTGTHVAQICWFLLTESRHIPAQIIQTSPPKKQRWRADACGSYTIIDLDLSRYDALADRFQAQHEQAEAVLTAGIETNNPAFKELITDLEHVSIHSDAAILLSGATGVGKTQLARRVFELKAQRRQITGKFIEVNCATLRGDQAMSALFGHTKGAFTGAQQARSGLLLAANNGMLFLDEIGELGLDEQAMLLRAIEEQTYLPVGSDEPVHTSFQLIAGTNKDLTAAVRAGEFREDLLARLAIWHYRLPGLSDRPEDLAANIAYELARFSSRAGRVVRMNTEAYDAFIEFAHSASARWPGNFRDLGAAMTRLATRSVSGRISLELVRREIAFLRQQWQELAGHQPEGADPVDALLGSAAEAIDLFDRVQLARVIEICWQQPNLSAAGRVLFAQSRKRKATGNDSDRLRKYLQKFGLSWQNIQAGRP